ncbi:caldesmon-like isoform X2 [Thamnophis elegans]|uniref:caldesmon-like isoform X2 n=1 Tax=Thamnophis elegans TaxID=35005 RepID=UPI001376ED0C|nr:caldesmon-like isoform X2 [Thamnophis elegans]
MENDRLRKLRKKLRCLQKEGERSRLPLLSSTTEERRRAEIVQTKSEKLEEDLKTVMGQSYTKLSSEELGQLEKLRQENERLRCEAQKEAAEKAELLRENKDLKEELNRKRAVMSKLTVECEELRNKTEILTFKNIELSDEKEAYEEILCREELQRISRCTLLTHGDQKEDKTEAQEKMKPQMVEHQLNHQWLKASVDRIKKSKEPGANILRWLQKSLKLLKEDSSERSKHTLPEWLKASATNLPEECAKAAREDVNDWLEESINHLQEKGPETCELDVEGWLQASIIGIQHLQKFRSESRGSRKKKGWLAEPIENLKKKTSCGDITMLRVEGRKFS